MATVAIAQFTETEPRSFAWHRHHVHANPEGSKRQRHHQVTVTRTSQSLVVPASPINHPQWLPLNNLDRYVNPTYASVIYFYEGALSKGSGESFNTVTAALKESLAKVLVDFYPMAGRLALKEETGVMDLHCNDAGAIFMEASVNVELTELGGPQPMPMLSGMDIMAGAAGLGPTSSLIYTPDHRNPAIPVLIVQVTRFACGSIAFAVNWHHTVADAFSGFHFMRCWTEVFTGQEPTLQPCHDRDLLVLRSRTPLDPSMVSNGHYTCNEKSDQQVPVMHKVSHREGSSQADSVRIPAKDHYTAAPKAPVVKLFSLSNETLRRLKENANHVNDVQIGSSTDSASSSDGQGLFTSVESVSAKLWKLMAKARSVADEDFRLEEKSRFFLFVNGRTKLGLPAGYFGNVVCTACAESTHGELLSKPLSYTSKLLQSAKRGVSVDYFRSLIDWVEERGIKSSTVSKSETVKTTGYDVAATFWNFFPLYEVNFGWGKPVLSVWNAPPRKHIDGICVMPGPDGSGKMFTSLNVQSDRMHNLENDLEFSETLQPVERRGRYDPNDIQTRGLSLKI